MDTRIYAGTASTAHQSSGGIYRLTIGDEQWTKLGGGLADAPTRAIAIHPREARAIYAGTARGPYRSDDGGESWRKLELPDGEMEVWSWLFHPQNPDVMYAGTAPAAVYRSEDGGTGWKRLAGFRAPGRVKMNFPCRVTRLVADPSAPRELYAGLEVDGIMRSLDGGESWEDVSEPLVKLAERPHLRSRIASDTEIEGMMDTHALCLSIRRPSTVFLAVRMGLFQSSDRGTTWEDMEIGRFSPLTYARDVKVSPHDPATLFACLSPAARSEDGALYRSDNLGRSWHRFDRGVTARSTMMAVTLHPSDPQQVHCVTRGGQVFATQDGGRSWQEHRLPEGVEDVYALACA
jgi:photosystem II stability/assembly factor-like uncharacterized protein